MICAKYPPKSGPGPTRMASFVKGLAETGLEPYVFTSKIKSGSISAQWFKLDNPFLWEDEAVGSTAGVGRTQPILEKFVNILVPMEPSWTLSLPGLRTAFKKFNETIKPDIIFTTSNPLASAVGGVLLKHCFKLPLITEFRDPWTQNPVRNWPTGLHYLVESFLERLVLRNADSVIMNTPTARANLLQKYNWLNADQVHVISHGYDGEAVFSPNPNVEAERVEPIRQIRLVHAGGLYLPIAKIRQKGFQDAIRSLPGKLKSLFSYSYLNYPKQKKISSPETILRAISEYNQTRAESMPQIKMDFIGGAAAQVQQKIDFLGLQNEVSILPRVSSRKIQETLRSYDLLFLTIPAIPNSPSVATKTFDYLATGRPVISVLPSSDQARILTTAKSGWTCRPNDVDGLCELFHSITLNNCELLRTFKADSAYVELFSRHHQINDLVEIIEQVIGNRPRASVISEGYKIMEPSLGSGR